MKILKIKKTELTHSSLNDVYPGPHCGEKWDSTDEEKVLHKLEKHETKPDIHLIVDNHCRTVS